LVHACCIAACGDLSSTASAVQCGPNNQSEMMTQCLQPRCEREHFRNDDVEKAVEFQTCYNHAAPRRTTLGQAMEKMMPSKSQSHQSNPSRVSLARAAAFWLVADLAAESVLGRHEY